MCSFFFLFLFSKVKTGLMNDKPMETQIESRNNVLLHFKQVHQPQYIWIIDLVICMKFKYSFKYYVVAIILLFFCCSFHISWSNYDIYIYIYITFFFTLKWMRSYNLSHTFVSWTKAYHIFFFCVIIP